ncbi:hypothetical protein LR48_Vigan07g255100 [Vigna angularis]|uniref:Uncharacterized protein n=1 Tax=Phaseolus angularis TaxID=3914 RepID=A0A0L9V1V1_PHAAN|nr:hypothetical protein LR48_Vigan07g255100 [Vigna angularis]
MPHCQHNVTPANHHVPSANHHVAAAETLATAILQYTPPPSTSRREQPHHATTQREQCHYEFNLSATTLPSSSRGRHHPLRKRNKSVMADDGVANGGVDDQYSEESTTKIKVLQRERDELVNENATRKEEIKKLTAEFDILQRDSTMNSKKIEEMQREVKAEGEVRIRDLERKIGVLETKEIEERNKRIRIKEEEMRRSVRIEEGDADIGDTPNGSICHHRRIWLEWTVMVPLSFLMSVAEIEKGRETPVASPRRQQASITHTWQKLGRKTVNTRGQTFYCSEANASDELRVRRCSFVQICERRNDMKFTEAATLEEEVVHGHVFSSTNLVTGYSGKITGYSGKKKMKMKLYSVPSRVSGSTPSRNCREERTPSRNCREERIRFHADAILMMVEVGRIQRASMVDDDEDEADRDGGGWKDIASIHGG